MAAAYADRGFSVVGVDVNEYNVSCINNKISPVPEPHVDELLKKNAERVRATMSMEEAVLGSDVSFVMVPTPTDETGRFTSRYVIAACEKIGEALRKKEEYHLVVVTSTVMPGDTHTRIVPILEQFSGKKCGVDFGYCYNPEFIAIGSVVRDLLNPDFLLVGEYDTRSGDVLAEFYTQAVENQAPLKRMSIVSAEIAKLSLNVFVTMKISFANTLAELCEQFPGADVDSITDAIGTDSRIGKKYLKAGVGYGGPCFPRDNRAFEKIVPAAPDIIFHSSVTDRINERSKKRLLDLVLRHADAGKRVTIIGLSYKSGTPVVEESHGIALALACLKADKTVCVYDASGYQHARAILAERVTYAASLKESVEKGDVLVVMNMDPAYNEMIPYLTHQHTVIDPWRVFRDRLPASVLYVPMGLGCTPTREIAQDAAFDVTPVERVAAYWDARPCNIRHSLAPVGTQQYFDEVEARKYLVEPHIPGFAEFEKWRGKRVLEVGCGIGTDTINFARAGARVTAVELSEKSLALARERARIFGLEDVITFYVANAEELSRVVPVEPYDLVYSFGVIHHTPHPERAIVEIQKYLHRESVLKIMVYHRHSWKVWWIMLRYGKGKFWDGDRLVANYSEAQTGCPVTYIYSKRQAKKLLQGFDILAEQPEHIFPYVISEYVQHRYKKVWYFRYLPTFIFHWLERSAGWHLCISARPRTT